MTSDLKIKEKIELKFHSDDALELTILELLNKDTFKREREHFIKRLMLDYFKSQDEENFNKLYKEIKEKPRRRTLADICL